MIIAVIFVVDWVLCEAGLRMLGGRNALKNEFPFAVVLEEEHVTTASGKTYTRYYQYCTGAALTSSWILAAAHCEDVNIRQLMTYKHISTKERKFARYNSYFPSELGQLSLITKVLQYPGYDMFLEFGNGITSTKYDIALFYTENIMVSQYGKISAMDYTSLLGHEVVVLGFGITNAAPESKPLQVLKGMLNKCDATGIPLCGYLCVVSRCDQKTKICGGDSGGPVVHASGIVAVNSVSQGDCDESELKLYTGYAAMVSMVGSTVDWISNTIANKTAGRS